MDVTYTDRYVTGVDASDPTRRFCLTMSQNSFSGSEISGSINGTATTWEGCLGTPSGTAMSGDCGTESWYLIWLPKDGAYPYITSTRTFTGTFDVQ